jgi:hypothetical protein
MPFYRHKENDLDTADGASFSPEDVPRAVVAVVGYMIAKGMELAIHERRKAQLALTLRGVVRCGPLLSIMVLVLRCCPEPTANL